MARARLGPEFSLLVRCCHWNFASAEDQPPPEIPAKVDWDRLLTLARRHRVQGLAWNSLGQTADHLPSHVKDALSSEARSIAATNLAIAAECGRLRQRFEEAKTPLLFIKGLSVGALAYRSPLLKMAWDIDLLIDPSDLGAASKLLTDCGYVVRIPANVADLEAWHGRSKESVWHRQDSFFVEVHTRLSDNQRLIPAIDIHSPRQVVEVVPGVSLPTLAEDELLAYLAVHGASSAWFRLKWISDFAALIDGRTGEEIERLHRRSLELGAARASAQALLLADSLFGVLRSAPELRMQLSKEWETQLLCRAALRMMTEIEGEPAEQPLGTMAIHWSQLLLKPGITYKFSEIWRQGSSLLSRSH